MVKIDKKIVSTSIKKESPKIQEATIVRMHEKISRPDTLLGKSYKVKVPTSEHAMYITINNIVLNENTPQQSIRPFEIFINSKNMENFQWIVALTRVISAVFRKGGDVTFLIEELESVFDPRGGYFKKGGKYMPSIVAEIGNILKEHLQGLEIIPTSEVDTSIKIDTGYSDGTKVPDKKLHIEPRSLSSKKSNPDNTEALDFNISKRNPLDIPVTKLSVNTKESTIRTTDQLTQSSSEEEVKGDQCIRCHQFTVISQSGCKTCTNCGESKCD